MNLIDDLVGITKKPPREILILFGTLILFLIAHTLFRNDPTLSILPPLIGIVIVIEIVYFVSSEIKEGVNRHGWKHEIVDTFVALLIAVGIWYGLSFVLNTSSPISAVVSCSMLPNLQRGDFVIVQGAPIEAYEISMNSEEFLSLNDRSTINFNGKSASIEGSLIPYCSGFDSEFCKILRTNPEEVIETKGPFSYKYATCPTKIDDGVDIAQACLESVTFKGTEYLTNFSHDTVVYAPLADDLYLYAVGGDIVHRTMFEIDVEGKKYYLTRGDNNPILALLYLSSAWFLAIPRQLPISSGFMEISQSTL